VVTCGLADSDPTSRNAVWIRLRIASVTVEIAR
jgi:hypothetical protein